MKTKTCPECDGDIPGSRAIVTVTRPACPLAFADEVPAGDLLGGPVPEHAVTTPGPAWLACRKRRLAASAWRCRGISPQKSANAVVKAVSRSQLALASVRLGYRYAL
jgi:hypothetical protein